MPDRTHPFLMRRYPWRKALQVMLRGGWALYSWGVLIPLTRHGGLCICWMRKERHG